MERQQLSQLRTHITSSLQWIEAQVRALYATLLALQLTKKLPVLVLAKKHPEGGRVMDEDIDMKTSAEVKQADDGDEAETMGAEGGA